MDFLLKAFAAIIVAMCTVGLAKALTKGAAIITAGEIAARSIPHVAPHATAAKPIATSVARSEIPYEYSATRSETEQWITDVAGEASQTLAEDIVTGSGSSDYERDRDR